MTSGSLGEGPASIRSSADCPSAPRALALYVALRKRAKRWHDGKPATLWKRSLSPALARWQTPAMRHDPRSECVGRLPRTVSRDLATILMTLLSLPLFGMPVVVLTARPRAARNPFARWALIAAGAAAPVAYSLVFARLFEDAGGSWRLPGAWWQGLLFTLLAACAYILFRHIDAKLRGKEPIVAFVASVLPFGLILILNHRTEVFSPDGALGIMTGLVWVAAIQATRRPKEPSAPQAV